MAENTSFALPGDASDLEEGAALTPKFGPDGLITCVATDAESGAVLMVAHMNADARQALEKRRKFQPLPTRRRDAHRLRSGRDLDQGPANRRRLSHRPTLVLLSGRAHRQNRACHPRIPRRAFVLSGESLR